MLLKISLFHTTIIGENMQTIYFRIFSNLVFQTTFREKLYS